MKNLVIELFFIIIVIIGVIGIAFSGYMNKQTITCEIEDKWTKRKNETDIYLVSCGDKVYKISDLLFKWKFDSSDIYSKLKVGKTYEITTTGFRIPLISEYQNINSYKQAKG